MPAPTTSETPGIVVILPTHRRAAPLVWSLCSVLVQRLPESLISSAKVVVVNNDHDRGPVEEAVRVAVADVGLGPWRLEVFHRAPTLDPVLSWYGAIGQFTRYGDVAFLQGDDDLMLKDSIAIRTRLLLKSGATMLASRAISGIVFDASDALHAYLRRGFEPPRPDDAAVHWGKVEDMDRYECSFIGNHAYRCTPAFFQAYQTTLARMEALPISGQHQRAMLPQLLAVAVNDGRGLGVTDSIGVVRGQTRDEVVGARWGLANWSAGVLQATVLAALAGPGWHGRRDLDPLRRVAMEQLAHWYFAGIVDKKTRAELRALGFTGVRQFRSRHWGRLLAGTGLVLKSFIGVRGLRTRLLSSLEKRSRADVIEQLRTAR